MKAQDAHTLVITLTRSNGSFPALLDIPIVKVGTENDLVPLGTGPYVYTTAADGAALTAIPIGKAALCRSSASRLPRSRTTTPR